MKKKIFNWDSSKNNKYKDRVCPDFDFVEGCKNGLVVWWDTNQFCIDLDKLDPIPHKCVYCNCQLYLENRVYHKGRYFCKSHWSKKLKQK